MVNFLQQRDDLYFSHPTIILISILPAEDNIEAMLDRDAAAAEEEEAERDGSSPELLQKNQTSNQEQEGRKLPFRAGS